MPCLVNFFAAFSHAARVLVGCGFMSSARSTSHRTSTFCPPRRGSGHVNTGFNTQSLCSPVACSVDEPSKPQIGITVAPSFRIFVFDRSSGVGDVPSIQMYSA